MLTIATFVNRYKTKMVEGGHEHAAQDEFGALLDTVDLITSQQYQINEEVQQSDPETRRGQVMR